MLKYSEDLNGLRHLKHSNHGSPDLRLPFSILHKKTADLAALPCMHLSSMIFPGGGTSPFKQEFHKLSTETLWNMESWPNLSTKSYSDIEFVEN